MRRGNHVDARRELVLFVNLRRAQARLLEAVVEAEREECVFFAWSVSLREQFAG